MISRPNPNSGRPAVLLVHGAWHGPWCWEGWMDAIESAGYPVHAIELPGHGNTGSPKRIWNRLRDYVAAVNSALDVLGDNVILVGHSMGGLVTQIVLEKRSVKRAILVASVPPKGATRSAIRVIARDPINALVMFPLGTMWTIVNTPEQVRQWFFSAKSDQADVDATGERLQNESILAFAGMLGRWPRPSKIETPVSVLAASCDAIFSVAEQQELAAAYDTTAVVIDGAGHDLMTDGPYANTGVQALLKMIG